ncbi:hypothetical protein [Inquilinus limosus]|uniref:Uncharacterized protein n=1 Tax=Inquilinus limosus MP06 TaxID=1398085 RepID=A0A0A0D2H9_9PROT|nr:hypothetical protein [Inquilinus limosus]KGM32098.1 hypothetical protein P409_23385 [Inquilinus limosus MP06]
MRTLESTATREALPPIVPDPGCGPRDIASRRVIRHIVVTAFAIALMAGAGLLLIDIAIDRLTSLSLLRLSGLF